MTVKELGLAVGLTCAITACSGDDASETQNLSAGGSFAVSGAGGMVVASGGAGTAAGAPPMTGGMTGVAGAASGGAGTVPGAGGTASDGSGGAAGDGSGGAAGDGSGGAAGSMSGADAGVDGAPDDASSDGTPGDASSDSAPGDDASDGAPGFTCQGKPGAVRGKSRQTVTIDGLERWFNYYAPSGLDPNTPAPLVIVPHGYFMDGDIMEEVTKYADLAEEERFVVAFPSGAGPTPLDPPWNIGTPAPQCLSTLGFLPMTQNDDQAFVDAIISFAREDQCIDPDHIFMTGFSMGAYFTNTTGCNREEIKAIAPHSGGSHDFANCPVTKKPVLLMHFDDDALIPYECATETRDRWLTLNGCASADPEVRMVNGGRCEYFKGCVEGGQVAMCTFKRPAMGDELFVGHAWSGGYEPQPVFLSGYAIPETESATRLSWNFFKEFAW